MTGRAALRHVPEAPDEVERTAAEVAASVEAIAKVMRRSAWDEARKLPVPLTAPQVLAMRVLVEAAQHAATEGDPGLAGLPMSTLASRLGLAHSTTSGIVDRLQRLGLVAREAHPDDRRSVLVKLTGDVATWLRDELPVRKASPVAAALRQSTAAELRTIRLGMATLEKVLARTGI